MHNLLVDKGVKVKYKSSYGRIIKDASVSSTYVVGMTMNANVDSKHLETIDISNIITVTKDGKETPLPRFKGMGQQKMNL